MDNKPTINQIAEMIGDEVDAAPEQGLMQIPGYGQVRPDQARSEAMKRFRMIADALEAGQTVPVSAAELAVEFLRKV
jgi:hypothetical protein